jgi:phospholipase A1/A2
MGNRWRDINRPAARSFEDGWMRHVVHTLAVFLFAAAAAAATSVDQAGTIATITPTAPIIPATVSTPADSAASVGELVFSLVSPHDAVAAGAAVRIDLIALNQSEREITFTPPGVLTATASARGLSRTVVLRADSAQTMTLAPERFGVQSYTLSLPDCLSGSVILSLGPELVKGLRAVVAVTPGGDALASGDDAFAPDLVPIRRAHPGRFGTHNSIYFIYGGDAPGAKFQVSMKYRVLSLARPGALLPQTLQFAYTQRSLWDITGKSSPFYDTSYMPELFCESIAGPAPQDAGRFFWLGYQFGYGHESNGRDGDTGRSINRLQAASGLMFTLSEDWYVIVTPQLFTYILSLSDNPRIRDYRSYGQLQMRIGRTEGPCLLFSGHVGRHVEHPTLQFDLTVPARIPLFDILAILMVQYFHGYGESLLAYEQKSDMVRAGFSLVQ